MQTYTSENYSNFHENFTHTLQLKFLLSWTKLGAIIGVVLKVILVKVMLYAGQCTQ